MKFYDRKIELETLRRIEELSHGSAQLTVITGRRRIGKTTLVRKAYESIPYIYFFVGRKSEAMLCSEFVEMFTHVTGEELGNFTSFAALLRVVMHIAKRQHLTIVFDEFQNFQHVNASLFSDFQNIWDSTKDGANINMIVCGSIYSMMTKIFDDRKEPLYGRATSRIKLREFPLDTLKEIMLDYNPNYTADDLLTLYTVTGGVAKYIEQLVIYKAFTHRDIINTVLSFGSYFIDEGREMLSDEFGRDYGNYFSVLSAVASGCNERGAIKSLTGFDAGGYLERLEKNYDLIYRYRPFLASERTQNVKYGIRDNFMNFWFRFIYKYRSAIEIGNLDYVRNKVFDDYNTYSGFMLERYFRQRYRETGLYNIVTNYWERGGKNEIDLIAVDDINHNLVVGESKRNSERINLNILENKASNILAKMQDYKVSYVALSLKSM
jgi:AAA+ ATPase superfamily predicted ATPase